jgi:CubicO group peptidase (beta-lactamase class C family)
MPYRRSRRIAAAAIVLCAACTAARSSSPRAHNATDVVRGDAGQRMDAYLSRASAFGFSGSVLVADSTGVVLAKGYGMADAARGIPNTPATLYDMGSMVKQFTAAAILLLESEGKLSTNDRLARFYPSVPSDKADITIHQLLTHTSGLVGNVVGDYDRVGRDSAIGLLWRAPLLSPPGQQFNYSNAGFALLGAIIEQVTGMPYERFMRQRLFDPAGMRETGYHLSIADSSRVAHTYTPPVDHGTPAARLAASNGPWWGLMANGGMLTTVWDVYRWEQSLRRGHPLPGSLQAKQFAEQFRRSPTLAHGYDWWIEPAEDGGVQLNRGGDAPPFGLNAEYRRYPKDGSAFILLANTRHHGASTRRFVMPNLRRSYLGTRSFDVPEARRATAEKLLGLAGYYVLDSAAFLHLEPRDGRLIVSAFGQRAADVLIVNRDSTNLRNRRLANERMVAVVRALATRDSAAAATGLGSAARGTRLMAAWGDAEQFYGRFRCVDVLGSDRLDRGALLTTVRLSFADSTKTVRSTWNGAVPIVNSDDGALVNNFGFAIDSPVDAGVWSPYWYVDANTIVTYDLSSDLALRANVVRDASGAAIALDFVVPGGTVRSTRAATPPPLAPAWCR